MSRHEAVSCDSCLKSNFRGRRYKCLMCYDYDLCANCYEDGVISTRHSTDHPMQCILARSDFDLYYSGEAYATDQPQSFTCPYCKKMGFSDLTLFDHVAAEHTDTGLEVVCPVCAALPGGDPNLVTDDFAGHLTVEHRSNARDLISFLDEPASIRHGGVRRIPHSGSSNRALGGPRSRRSNMHFNSAGTLSALSPAGRDSVDPISELLSQLTGVRRGAPQPSQLQQLQMQIQLERQQVTAARQNLERLPRRQPHLAASTSNTSVIGSGGSASAAAVAAAAVAQAQQAQNGLAHTNPLSGRDITITSNPIQMATAAGSFSGAVPATAACSQGNAANSAGAQSQFLLSRFLSPALVESEHTEMEHRQADRSLYVQDLLLSTLSISERPASPQMPSPALEVENAVADEGTDADASLSDALPVTVSAPHHHLQHSGRVPFDKSGASAKLKNAAMGGGGGGGGGNGKPVPIGDRARTASGVARHQQPQQQQQQQQQSVKAREMKNASMSAKESTDSTR